MISVSISPDGEIVISQETPGERIYMGEHYARMEREERGELKRSVSMDDDERAAMFKQGWESAIRESQLQYVNGRIEDFWNEMGVKDGSEDPHHNEPEGTGEAWDGTWPAEGQEDFELPLDTGVARPVADSGEPEKEAEADPLESQISRGAWTISNEELQSRLDAEFERGLNYSSSTVPPRYSAEQIAELRTEAYERGIADRSTVIKFSALRAIADRVASQSRSDGEHASVDDLLREVAIELGYEVTR